MPTPLPRVERLAGLTAAHWPAVARQTSGSRGVGVGAAALAAAVDDRRRHVAGPLSVWCAGAGGCAEPATVVLLAHAAGVDVDVIATDISHDAVDDINDGAVDGTGVTLPRAVVDGRVVVDDRNGGWRVGREVRAAFRGAQGSLDDVPGGGPFDVIVCRDVLHHYRSDVAMALLRGLAERCADGGVIVISAVDAMSCSLPIEAQQVILRVQDGALIPLVDAAEYLVGGDDVHPALKLAALFDTQAEIADRAQRLLTLSGRGGWLEEARLGAAALAMADHALGEAEALLAPLSEGVSDVVGDDRRVLLALLSMLQGRSLAAVEHLMHVHHPSWLAPYVLAQVWRRSHREAMALAQFRVVERHLKGSGDAPPSARFLTICDVDAARAVCAAALRPLSWHGP